MIIHPVHFSSPSAITRRGRSLSKRNLLVKAMAFGVALAGAESAAHANPITLTTSDAAGTSSYSSNLHWSDGLAPAAGNSYFTGALVLRTPAITVSGDLGTFGGDSLSIDTGGRFLGKIGNNVAGNSTAGTMTINNLILNGGAFDQAGNNSDTSMLTVGGSITVNASSTIGALGAAGNASVNFETLNITATISGSGALTVGGTQNGGADTGVVRLNAANPYSGNITVATPGSGFIASTTNRLLQLSNLNALQNATLTISANNGISFASAVNTGPFRIGALSGASSQVLTDTAGAPVVLNIGGNNASTTYAGTFTGGGALVKTGTGTFISSGSSSETGGVTISGGTYQMGAGGTTGNAGQSGSTITFNGDDTRLLLNRSGNIWNYNIVVGGSGSGLNTIAAVTAIPTSWSGTISGSGGQTLQFNDASNAGSITLLGNNTYSNPTTVFSGTLVVNGSIGNSTVTVNNAAKLGGGTTAVPGTIGAIMVNPGGTLAPGSGIGTLTTGPVSFAAGGIFGLEINTTTAGTDLVSAGGLALALTNDTVLSITDLAPAAVDAGTFTFVTYPLGTWNGGLFSVGGSAISDYDEALNPNSTTFAISGNTYRIDYDANGNSVVLMAVPEPGAATAFLGGLGLLLARRRRKNSGDVPMV